MVNNAFHILSKLKVQAYLCRNIMTEQLEKSIPLKCTLEPDGTVSCGITKEQFNDIQRKNIKPKRVIFEIE